MPRPTTIGAYAVVSAIALTAGLLIATALRTSSLPTGMFVTPVAAASLPSATTAPPQAPPTIAALPPDAATDPPASPTRAPPVALNVSLPTTATAPTPSPSPPPTQVPTQAPISAPRPVVFAARVFDKPTDAAVKCGTAFASRVWGVVKDRNGRGVYRAIVQISSTDGKNRFSRATNNQGGFEVPGLGCTRWVVRLISVPRAPGVQAQAVNVGLNGGRYSGAGIEFRQR
jgi:hypothetical protein